MDHMDISFTRSGERRYRTIATRDDRVTLSIPSFDRPKWFPHDLGHFVVEQVLGLRLGFWGCVAAGVIFPGMKVIHGRLPPHSAERSRAVCEKWRPDSLALRPRCWWGFSFCLRSKAWMRTKLRVRRGCAPCGSHTNQDG